MRRVIERLVDAGDWLEVQPRYGASLVCALAWVGGQACAIVANDPSVRAGSVDSAAAIKAMDFLETAGSFNLPVVFLADNPGVMAGTKAEREGILKWAGRMFQAERRLRVPIPFERDGVTAHLAEGFLTVTLPRRAPARVRVPVGPGQSEQG